MPALVLILLAIACVASWPTAASGAASGKGARGAASSATVCLAAATACLTGAATAAAGLSSISWLGVVGVSHSVRRSSRSASVCVAFAFILFFNGVSMAMATDRPIGSCCDGVTDPKLVSPSCAVSQDGARRANDDFERWSHGHNAGATAAMTRSLLYGGRVPVADACVLERIGKHGVEAKMACNLDQLVANGDGASAGCTIISIGSENKWEFETEMFARTPCRIETFDCTGVGLGWVVPAALQSRVRPGCGSIWCAWATPNGVTLTCPAAGVAT